MKTVGGCLTGEEQLCAKRLVQQEVGCKFTIYSLLRICSLFALWGNVDGIFTV